ncbi:MAG: hypothetical protein K8S13_10045, partial [Desulfobacula sp.]|uniref:hypothetical protein n=1 Tax=Desulfobacula sp. TaxID=2593537 RepID=UPI0025BABCA0
MRHLMVILGCFLFFWVSIFSGIGFTAGFYGVSESPTSLNYGVSISGSNYIHYVWNAQGYTFKDMGLSGDGSTVVSGYYNSQGIMEPYRWTRKDGRKWLGFSEPCQNVSPQSYATAVSYDGSYITGRTRVDQIRLYYIFFPTRYYVDMTKGFIWHNNNFTGLPWIYGHKLALPFDISGSGSVVIGNSRDVSAILDHITPGDHAVTWESVRNYNVSGLGVYAGDDDSLAFAVSNDGSAIVGVSGNTNSTWLTDSYWDPVVNKNGSGWQRLAKLSTATIYAGFNNVLGVSADGAKAVGCLYDGAKSLPSFWDTTTLQAFALSQLPGKNQRGCAFDVSGLIEDSSFPSGKGYIAVGELDFLAVMWKVDQTAHTSTVERVDSLLTSLQLGNKIKGWKLKIAHQVSDDGKTFAGQGFNQAEKPWIWFADLNAPPPANDDCDKAQNISITSIDTEKKKIYGTTKNATHDVYQACSSGKRLSVWYRFTAPAEGFIALDLCGSSALQDPALSVFDNCWGGLENGCNTGCNGNPCTEPCLLGNDLVKVEQGQDYYIMVSSKNGVPGSNFTLNYQFLPINNECAEAFFVGTPSETPGQTWLATIDSISPCQGVIATAPGVWYKVVGNGNTLTASTCDAMTDYDTQISVYCSGCPTLTCVGANDDDTSCGGGKSSVTWCAESGMVYYIFVHGFQSQTGNFKLKIIDSGTSCSLSVNCHPSNEDCQEAIPLNQGTLMVDNSGTNPIGGSSTCGGYNDIWFSYTTQCNGEVTIDTVQSTGTLEDTIISVYESCGGPEYGCNDDYDLVQFGKRSAITLPSPGNRKHLIQASSYEAYDVGTFPLRVTEVVDPVDIVPWALPDASQYMEYLYQLPVSGGCPFWFDGERGFYSVTADNLPPG